MKAVVLTVDVCSDTTEGELALHGIYLAWTQRLMFTVGQSITTGRDNCITWNDLHMKTNVRSVKLYALKPVGSHSTSVLIVIFSAQWWSSRLSRPLLLEESV